ncbi:hypothetical protein DIURU_003716 [Diutina rugosa]|uniref:Uncharacterized protein n=1 Tax=Diutina rugosa TaxID=5481 RepID=A0A642UPC4_DIURU|nr:uncharacterized protein DIURU_003716 [Diutina rugosa]KAA8900604.1 hypothetical protein DIURU_003716 [Diutina rugosa]
MPSWKWMFAVAGALAPVALADSSDTTEFVTEDATVTVTGEDYASTSTVKVIAKVYETEYIWTDAGTLTSTVITGATEFETVTTDATDSVETERATVSASPEVAETTTASTDDTLLTSGSLYSNSSSSAEVSSAFEPSELPLSSELPVETGVTSETGVESSSSIAPESSSEPVSVASEVPEVSSTYANSTVPATSDVSDVPSTGVSETLSQDVSETSSEVAPSSLSLPVIANSSVPIETSSSLDVDLTSSDVIPTLVLPTSSVYDNATSIGADWISTLSQSIPEGSYGEPSTITSTTTWQGELAVLHLVVLPTEVCDC